MVYIESLDNFVEAAQQLFISSPQQTRYLVKYRHVDAQLVLKVTDDKVCIKFKTDQAQDVKKIEKLNSFFMRLMSAKTVDAATAAAITAAMEQEEAAQAAQAVQTQPQQTQSKKGGKRK